MTGNAAIRIVHLGLGGFFRAHQAWYTGAAPDADGWRIAAFAGRSAALAERLTAQDCRYTLVVRGPDGDEMTEQHALAAAHSGTADRAWRAYLARPEIAVLTLTVTEKAYDRAGDLGIRLIDGLAARREAGAGPIALVSCDNLPENGTVLRKLVEGAADPELAGWIRDNVAFVTTMVDRITPRTTDADVAAVAAHTGWADAAPVVTEPFTEWVLGGEFPAGRPAWEAAGARFVTDVRPHETRKLLLLNGGHSLLAYAGSARGHETVADAVADPECRRWLDQWWDEASRYVPLPAGDLVAYRKALLIRFANPRIRHTLAQIAADGSQKVAIRVLPVLRGERAAGRMPAGAIRTLAAWIAHLRGAGAPVDDAGARPYRERAGSARDVLALLAPDLAGDDKLIEALEAP